VTQDQREELDDFFFDLDARLDGYERIYPGTMYDEYTTYQKQVQYMRDLLEQCK
jgi:hypothetical protein